MIIQAIVEGHGEVEAIPLLLRRICHEVLGCYSAQIAPAMKMSRGRICNETHVAPLLRIACGSTGCTMILVIFDADDDCPKILSNSFKDWITRQRFSAECEIVAITREYEAWFLASINSLRGKRGIPLDACSLEDVEEIRGAKERLSSLMPRATPYVETSDQPALTADLDLHEVMGRCRSFRRLIQKIREHHERCNCNH